MSKIFATNIYAAMLAGHYETEPQGGLFAKSYDKDFNRKKKHRKMAKASKQRNRKNLRSRKCI